MCKIELNYIISCLVTCTVVVTDSIVSTGLLLTDMCVDFNIRAMRELLLQPRPRARARLKAKQLEKSGPQPDERR